MRSDAPLPAAVTYRGFPVPYIAAWTGEREQRKPHAIWWRCGANNLRFVAEGVNAPGQGKPLYSTLHGDRCREVLARDLCQICVRPLDAARYAVSYGKTIEGRPLISDGLPMHPWCVLAAYRACPALPAREAEETLRIWRTIRGAYDLVPIVLGIVDGPGADAGTNDLVRRFGRIFSGPDMLLTRWAHVSLTELADLAEQAKVPVA